jgi:glycolate oxidase iron-sulfur subunit
MARDLLEEQRPELSKKALLASTTSPLILKTQLTLGRLWPGRRVPGPFSRWVSGQAPEADQPVPQTKADLPPLDEALLPAVKGEVYLLEGCAMRVLFPRVHQATRRLLRRVGYVVRETEQGCCGSFHAHNGFLEKATEMAHGLIKSMPDDLPVIVDSAGCGSTMKEYGHLVAAGEAGAHAFASRVKDISEFLLANGLLDALAGAPGIPERVTYHDACHLSHGQRITSIPRQLVKGIPRLEYVELPEAEMCCGSAGIYNMTEPAMARTLVERKYSNVETTQAAIVAMGNPGCHAWIAQAAREHGEHVRVMHTAELLEAAFVGLDRFS